MTNEELVREIQAGNNVQGNLEALYNQNRGMIAKEAAYNAGYSNCEKDDLMQEGFLGLQYAALKYDLTANNGFDAYAFSCVRGRCRRYIRDNAPIRIPDWKCAEINKLGRYISEYRESHNGNDPDDSEICSALGISKETLSQNRSILYMRNPDSLQWMLDEDEEDGKTKGDFIADNRWMEAVENNPSRFPPAVQDLLLLVDRDKAETIREVIMHNQSVSVVAKKYGIHPDAIHKRLRVALGTIRASNKLKDLVDNNDYDSSIAYKMSAGYAATHFTSSTEMLAIRRVMIEQQLEHLENDSVSLQRCQSRLEMLLDGVLTDTRKGILTEIYWNGRTGSDIAREIGTSRTNVNTLKRLSIKLLKDDGRIYDIARDARKAFKQYKSSQLTPEMISLKDFLKQFSDPVSDRVSDKKG